MLTLPLPYHDHAFKSPASKIGYNTTNQNEHIITTPQKPMNDLERLLNFSQELLATLDFSGEFRLTNAAFQRLMRSIQDTFSPPTLIEIFEPEDQQSLHDALEVLQRGHPVIERVNRLRTSEGPLPVRWSAFPSLEQDSIYFVGRLNDLSASNLQRLRFALDISPVAMLVVDGAQGTIDLVNGLFCQLFGYKESEVLGAPMQILLPEEYRTRHQQHQQQYLRAPNLRPMGTGKVFQARDKNGQVFPLDIGLNPLQTPEGLKVVCSLVDLTRRKALVSEILERTKALREELAAMEKLASTDELTGVLNRRAY